MPANSDDWTTRFEALAGLDASLSDSLKAQSKVLSLPAKSVLFGPGDPAASMVLLLSGTVRVQQVSDSGHEIVLYRIHAGESCVLTTACLLSHETYAATGIAETPIKAVAIPRQQFDALVAQSSVFRNFVFSAFSKRITDLFMMVDEVAFQRIDVRLAHRLTAMSDSDGVVTATHQQLSVELGTAREVVSRHLQEFQRRGWLVLARNKIKVIDREKLEILGASSGGSSVIVKES